MHFELPALPWTALDRSRTSPSSNSLGISSAWFGRCQTEVLRSAAMSKNIGNFTSLEHHCDAPYEFGLASGRFSGQTVTVHLDSLQERLLEWLSFQEAVVGCVAWLTNEAVIGALNGLQICQVTMQKEDWMRPDYDGKHPAKVNAALYRSDAGFDRYGLSDLPRLSYCGDPGVERFRCFGHSGDPGTRPVMHHKFLVGCSISKLERESDQHPQIRLEPQSVWAGSFNMTKGARRNMDSAMILGPEPARLYLREWVDVLSHSEPLDFEQEHCTPEWRIGS